MSDRPNTRFAALLVQQSAKMSGYARRLAGSEADADDLLQDTLMRCWSARHTFEDGTSLIAWMRTVMRNRYISGTRRSWRTVYIDTDILNDLLSVPPSQETAVLLKDAGEALERLPTEQRSAVLLASEGLFMEEASRRTGISVGAFKSRLMRGRIQLRILSDGRARAAEPIHSRPYSVPGIRHDEDLASEVDILNSSPAILLGLSHTFDIATRTTLRRSSSSAFVATDPSNSCNEATLDRRSDKVSFS